MASDAATALGVALAAKDAAALDKPIKKATYDAAVLAKAAADTALINATSDLLTKTATKDEKDADAGTKIATYNAALVTKTAKDAAAATALSDWNAAVTTQSGASAAKTNTEN